MTTPPSLAQNFSAFSLQRVPADTQLQAWNAADELVLSRLSPDDDNILLINDSFGSLAVALDQRVSAWWNDSAMARQALQHNCARNQRALPKLIHSSDELPDDISCAIIQIPKSVALFDWQLGQLTKRLAANGKVYALGMVKHLSAGHQKTMRRWFDQVNPGRAEKKARCVELGEPLSAEMVQAHHSRTDDGLKLISEPGCFSAQKTDPGALVFLKHFAQLPNADRVLDLGCGNGILALSYLRDHPSAMAIGIDESAQAIASARASAEANKLSERLELIHNNGLTDLDLKSVPLVLCNPPFHQDTSLTDVIAEQLIKSAALSLAKDGEFWLVGNRHLGYHQRLKRYFRQVEVKSSHPKFVVLAALDIKN
ncbi:methyltransferase [Saccharospirillum sp. HFRX-1]|uniref:class I SAM-dependent methyltransferase n=1 Tax=unclassified Saccharospirillum TaxID=2633430 RepID=UPI00371DDB6A